MKISEVYPAKYIKGEDLKGKEYSLTIARVEMAELHPQPGAPAERKPVVYFEEASKGLILGPAVARQIAAVLGDDTDTWASHRITIYPQPMRVAGKDQIAIRARRAANGPSQPSAELTEEE